MKANPRLLVLMGMIVAAALVRLLPHPPNFVPIAAMALFAGAYFKEKRLAYIVPIAAMLITDLIIGLHNTLIAVYLSFALIVFIGSLMIKQKKVTSIALASVTASVSFFIITNFAVWLVSPLYPATGAGLAACYTAAIPFFHYTLLGDLFYAGILFGAFEFAKIKFPVLARANS